MTQISLRFEIEDVTLGEKFFRKVVISEDQFELSRFDLVDHLAEDLKRSVIAKWRSQKKPPPASA